MGFLLNTLALWRLRHDPRVWPALMMTALMTATTVAVVVSLLLATLQDIAKRTLAFRALVCEYPDGEGWSAPDLYVLRPSDAVADCACDVASFGGRVLDPRTLPGLAASGDDVTLTAEGTP